MRDEQRNKNTQAYLVGKISWPAILIASIVPIWQLGGLSFSEILFLQGLFALILLILEVPTGVLADAMERRKVIILGYLFITLGFLIYARSSHFWGFLLAESTFAFGLSSLSGSEDAMLWDSYILSQKEDEIKKILTNGRIITTVSAAIMMIAGGIIANYQLRAPFYVGAICSLFNIVLYLRSEEPERIKLESARLIWVKSLGSLRDKQFIKILILFSTSSVMLRIAFWAYIPKMQEQGLTSVWFGVVLAGANVIASISMIFMRKQSDISFSQALLVFLIMGIGLVLFIPTVNIPLILIAIMCHQIGRGVINVISAIRINQVAESDVRASVASLMSMLGSLFYVISTVTFDLMNLSMQAIMTINAITFIGFAFIWIALNISERNQIETIIQSNPVPNL